MSNNVFLGYNAEFYFVSFSKIAQKSKKALVLRLDLRKRKIHIIGRE